MHTKHSISILTLAGMLSAAALTGCVDQDYSLDDIDMEMQLQFNDLALPINVSPVKLSSIIDLSEQDNVEIVNGKYALVRSEEFSSTDIQIEALLAKATAMDASELSIPLPYAAPNYPIDIPEFIHNFNYDYNEVDKHIVAITSGTVDMNLTINIMSLFTTGIPLKAEYKELEVVLPKGFYGTFKYGNVEKEINPDAADYSNVIKIDKAVADDKGNFELVFHVTAFDLVKSGGSFDSATNNFILKTSMGFNGGKISYSNGPSGAAKIDVNIGISPLDIKTINGEVGYQMTEWDTQIMFDNLPDVLKDPQTDLSLYNPQLYLSLTNPLKKSAYATTGVVINQIRDGADHPDFAATLTKKLEVKNVDGDQEFCLLPHLDKYVAYGEYSNPAKYEMVNLGNIVAGNGFPQGLKVNFTDPGFPEQEVTDFPLNFEGRISGKYTLFAPLQLNAGSQIYYQEKVTDWGLSTDSEDMDISQLTLEADVHSNLPVEVVFTAKPINSNGDLIPNINIDQIKIPAGGKTEHVVIKMEGEIKDLDGMEYIAKLEAPANANALSPDSYIQLENLKIRVTGKYIIKEDNDED